MRQQTLVLAVLGTALLVTAGVAGALTFGSGPATAGQAAPSDQSITVSADGEVEAEPDQALVRVAVTATGNDSTAVRSEIAERSAAMQSALEEYGISEENVRTVHFTIRQERERTPEGGVERGQYVGTHAFEITVEDTDAAGEVVDVAVDNGADRVDGVSFTLSDEKRESLYQDALTAAMGNAETRAETLADAGDLSVTATHSIVSADTNYRPYHVESASFAADSGSAGGGTSVQSGPVTVTADVRVTYNATVA
ncbi:SIMPL domain-containing protein [Halobacterium sp. R2-5]|uniref:SIMPL domain-containing protein n=1 Tax=Halobacterium sp. R2-5 TaxID=2715751 RepID=UPI00141F6695|nr:SIMPL domain-containing protein [Halobacterium sp. R2-5]NIB98392.1 SIMPL domain-containing protein [Halobacterium sp. R2-5]